MTTKTLELYRGDTKRYSFTFKRDGVAIDITGYTIRFTVKREKTDSDSDAVITKDVTSHTNAAGGESAVDLSSAETNVPEGSYCYDIQTTDAGGAISTVLAGAFIVTEDVTKRTS